jgi:hypothetical protein
MGAIMRSTPTGCLRSLQKIRTLESHDLGHIIIYLL